MEKFSYNSYPDSADSSPRSREIDFDNPSPWEDQQQQQQQPPSQSYKVKFLCSYGGKIQPRPHDNQLAYVGGETKILSVDRGIRFTVLVSRLTAIVGGEVGSDVTFKYQLPGEDLDALISVTNDDDLEHMMHEYDRLLRTSSKPARMRLFLFPVSSSSGGFGSEGSTKSDRDRFVEALNSVPSRPESEKSITAPPNNADFLFGSEKGVSPPPQPPPAVKVREAAPESMTLEAPLIGDQRVISLDHGLNPVEMQRQLQEFQRLQIRDQEQQQLQQQLFQQQQQEAVYRRKSEDGIIEPGGYFSPAFAQNPPPVMATVPQQTSPPAPAGFWQGKHIPGGVFPATTPGLPEQPVYMIQGPAPGTVYHAQPPPGIVRPIATGQGTQGYYPPVQRMPADAYREHPTYSVVQPPPQPQPQQQPQQQPPPGTQVPPPFSSAAPPPPYSAVAPPRPVMGSGPIGLHDQTAYPQVTYDGTGMGKQVYYTAPGGAIVAPPQPQPQYHGIGVPISGMSELRTGQDGKVAMAMAPKVSQSSDSA